MSSAEPLIAASLTIAIAAFSGLPCSTTSSLVIMSSSHGTSSYDLAAPSDSITTVSPSSISNLICSASIALIIPIGTVFDCRRYMDPFLSTNDGAAPDFMNLASDV